MGTIYRKTVTRPLPPGAEIITRKGQRLARWKRNGKTCLAPIFLSQDGQERIRDEAGTYTAKYRDGNSILVECSTGCRDADAARKVLGELERRAELVKAGVVTAAENAVADHQSTPLADHFAIYLDHLHAKNASQTHRDNVRRQLKRLAADCPFTKLPDLNRDGLERWLAARTKAGMGARTRNTYLAAITTFCNWCIETRRLNSNPFARVARADEKADCRRQRRALTEAELIKLLDVTRRRPLLDAMTIRRGKRKGEPVAVIRDDVRQRLERLGQERALIYKTLVLTGLRRNELATLTIGQLDLKGPLPSILLDAADEKNRAGSTLPIRSDLAADLALWVKEMETRDTDDRSESDSRLCLPLTAAPPANGPSADTLLFTVPKGLIRIFDRDLKLADIPKRDERGRTVDVHAMRTSFCTMLAKGGIAPRTAMAAARHSDIKLTMGTYTDPKLLDVAGSLDVLPALPLHRADDIRQEQKATGTYGNMYSKNASTIIDGFVAPLVAPNAGQAGATGSISDNFVESARQLLTLDSIAVSSLPVKKKPPLTIAVNRGHQERAKGLEPSTSSLGS